VRPSLNIAILANSQSISGGNNVLLEHAGNLVDRGHSVTMVVEGEVDRGKLSWHRRAPGLEWLSLDAVGERRFDLAIASFWRTCYQVARIPAERYVYFNQSVESRFYPEAEVLTRSYADLTYCLGLDLVTEASWIREHIRERYRQEAYLVPNGVSKDLFRPEGPRHAERVPGRLRLLVEGPLDVGFKNVKRSIELCRRAGADELWLLTSTATSSVQGVDRVFSRVPIAETPPIYRSCDAIVKLSYVEGMFGPPLEMFHCGGTAVVYDVTGHEEYIRHGENALVAAMGDEAEVLRHIERLRGDPELLAALKARAAETAREWIDWPASTDLLERALEEIAAKRPSNAATVKVRSELVAALASSASGDINARLEEAILRLPVKRFTALAKKYLTGKLRKRMKRY